MVVLGNGHHSANVQSHVVMENRLAVVNAMIQSQPMRVKIVMAQKQM